MFNRAPVALRCTLISLDRARRVSGTKAPDLAIFVLLSSVNLFNKKSLHRVHDHTAHHVLPSLLRNQQHCIEPQRWG